MAAPVLQMIPPAVLSAQAALEIAFPVLPPHAALCIGVTLAPALFAAIPNCCYEYTSVAEQERAGRFLYTGDALRHLYGRALLRQAALAYGVMRGIQEFDLNPWGKPVFPGASLQGNISHSGMQVWLALARDCEIGIDIESSQAPPILPTSRGCSIRRNGNHTRCIRSAAGDDALLDPQGGGGKGRRARPVAATGFLCRRLRHRHDRLAQACPARHRVAELALRRSAADARSCRRGFRSWRLQPDSHLATQDWHRIDVIVHRPEEKT